VGDHEADARVRVTAQQLFDYVSDVANMPKYLPRMRTAEQNGDLLHVSGKLDGGEEVARDVELKIDQENHTLTWSSTKHGYHGHLTVVGYGVNSALAVTVSTEHGDPRVIQQGVEETVATIKKQVEGKHPRPVFNPGFAEPHPDRLD
jgi:hypothetical protein